LSEDKWAYRLTKGNLGVVTLISVDKSGALVVETVQAMGLFVHKVAISSAQFRHQAMHD